MEVAYHRACPHCDGEGYVLNPRLEEFIKRHGIAWRVAAMLQWGEDESRWPQWEIKCPACNGQGTITERAPLRSDYYT